MYGWHSGTMEQNARALVSDYRGVRYAMEDGSVQDISVVTETEAPPLGGKYPDAVCLGRVRELAA